MRLTEIDRGARGQEVQMLQHLLNTTHKPRPPLDLDGVFGPMTERTVRAYQSRHGLEVDGIVGSETWKRLGVSGQAAPVAAAPSIAAQPTRAVPVPSVRQLPIGTATPRATAARQAAPRTPPLQPPGTAIGAPWMRVALAEHGVTELPGSRNTRRIMEYHAATSLGSQPDSVPWCASFVNWCLAQVGVRGTRSAAAASFRNWGTPLSEPRYGAIVQLFHKGSGHDRATGSSSGNHVGFFISKTATHVRLLGGNQRDTVKESGYPLSSYEIKAIRWPA